MGDEEPTKTINGQVVRFETRMVSVDDLVYYTHNPRLMSVLEKYEGEVTQETTDRLIWDRDETHTLFQSIKKDGGLHESLLVNKGVVIEGNTRLCCIRRLCKENHDQWHIVPCEVIVDELTPLQIQRILIDKHVIGKNDWSAYDKSLLYYKLKHEEGITSKEIAELAHESEPTINKRIAAIEKYKEYKCEDIKKYSHFEQYVTNAEIKTIVEREPRMEQVIVEQILDGKITTAQEVRKIPAVVRDKTAKKAFISGSIEIGEIVSDMGARAKFQNSTVTKAARDLNDKVMKMSKEDIDCLKENNQDKEDLRKLINTLVKLAKDAEIRLPNQIGK